MTINFGFSEEQELYREQIKRFAHDVLLPNRQKRDQERKTPGPMVRKFFIDRVMSTILKEEMKFYKKVYRVHAINSQNSEYFDVILASSCPDAAHRKLPNLNNKCNM